VKTIQINWRVLAGVVLGIIIGIVSFQNCSKGGIASESFSEQSSSESENPQTTVGSQTSSNYPSGQHYGNCTMQLNGEFKVIHNGAIDSSGNRLANIPSGLGGATWPVTTCPNTGSNLGVQCAEGFKAVLINLTQMDCRTSPGAANCWTYWASYACAKLSDKPLAAASPAKGAIAGNCVMQTSGDFKIAHNGSIDSSGRRLANVPDGVGGATWPVTTCPNSGSNTEMKCSSGWKVITNNVVQMDCRTDASQPFCWTYWITQACAKL
jgi:hypothetical protein